jgi:hypothetical protein
LIDEQLENVFSPIEFILSPSTIEDKAEQFLKAEFPILFTL